MLLINFMCVPSLCLCSQLKMTPAMKLSTSINMSIAIKDTLKKSDIDSLSKTIVANIGSILDSISKAIANNVESVIGTISSGLQRRMC